MAIIYGTEGNDVRYGGDGSDIIYGGAFLFGDGSGDDYLYGGSGNDRIYGGEDDDWLDGGFGFDTLYGGNGTDSTSYTFYNASIRADLSSGVVSFPGNSTLTDTLVSIERLYSGNGLDTIYGTSGSNILETGGGDDRVYGYGGNDILRGEDGNDYLYGHDGDDDIYGSSGDDWLDGGYGSDDIYGGSGFDETSYTFYSGPIVANLATGFVTFPTSSGADRLYDVEGIHATNAADELYGNDAGNLLDGNGGGDTISGLLGEDTLYGGSGNDLLYGGDDSDAIYGGAENDSINGGVGDDTMDGGLGNDRYVVGSAGDVITGEIGYSLGGGIDTVESFVDYALPSNVEILRLQGGANLDGYGNAAPEAVVGNTGSNGLDGRGGDDLINGKAGNDTITGGAGQDDLVGDPGADVFVYNTFSDSRPGQALRDLINGFEHGSDRIDLSNIDANPYYSGNQAFEYIGTAAFTGGGPSGAGELRWFTFGGGDYNIVEADWQGDGVADMQIFINLTNYMTEGDFIL